MVGIWPGHRGYTPTLYEKCHGIFNDHRVSGPRFNVSSESTVAAVESFRFLGSTISQDLKWDNHIASITKKAQQRLYFLRQLRKFNLPQELLKQFYSAIIETVLCSSITVWFGSATKTDIRRLQQTVRTAERIIGAPLPSLQELYTSRVRNRTRKSLWTPHTQLSLWTVALWPALQSTEHQNSQTQEQFLPPGHIPPEQHTPVLYICK